MVVKMSSPGRSLRRRGAHAPAPRPGPLSVKNDIVSLLNCHNSLAFCRGLLVNFPCIWHFRCRLPPSPRVTPTQV